jgi:nitrogen fixation NifU-like protein
MQYSQKVMDHYTNPRNIGSFDEGEPDVGTGMVGSPVCGDVMKLQLKFDPDNRIIDARFKTFGCGSAIASASYVTELLKGKTIQEASQIRNKFIAEELQLPPIKVHCSVLAEDAIKAAIEDYKRKKGDSHEAPRPDTIDSA